MSEGPAALPPLYERWMNDHLPGPVESEPQATCYDCVMCRKPDGSGPLAAYPFKPNVKCCTYEPSLANFLVGAILSDDDPSLEQGKESVRDRIASGVMVTPLGLLHSPPRTMLQKEAINAHGRSDALRCPHFREDTKDCGIWKYRDAVCATWFCKHSRGGTGHQFWMLLKEVLTSVERSLARWCLAELDFSVGSLPANLVRAGSEDATGQIDPYTLDEEPNPGLMALHWGSWRGREEAFYRACWDKVQPLSWQEVLDICGPDVRLFAEVLLVAWDRLQATEMPERVRLGTFQMLGVNDQGATVVTYSPFDPIGIPAPLMTALHYFDGRPTQEVFQALADERGLQLDEELLKALLDWRILLPA